MNSLTTLKKTLLLGAVLALAGACAPIPPERDALAPHDPARIDLASSLRQARDGWPQARWWRDYHDDQLTRLIEQALAGAPGLDTAGARLQAARAALSLDRAAQGARLDLDAGANRQRYSGNGLFPEPIGGSYYNDLSVQLAASYDFDWWGRQRAQVAAAIGEVNASQADYAQAELALASAVAQSYFEWQGGRARLANLREMLATGQALMALKARRQAQGLANADERSAVALDLVALEREAAALDAQNRRELEALRALLGAGAHALDELAPRSLHGAAHLMPSRLGLDLLARRADLQAARWRVEASLSRIDADKAAFYPDINLRASFGLDAVSLGTLLKSNSRTLFAGPALSLPLFDSGRLQAGLGIARAERNEMMAQYNQRIVDAVREVAQSGIALQGLGTQIERQADAVRASDALLRSARVRAEHGLADRAAVLNAQLAQLRERDTDLQLHDAQLRAEVALTQALGGGYWVESAAPAGPSSLKN